MKYFTVYIDILGFEEIAKHTVGKLCLTPEEIRQNYRNRVLDRLNALKDMQYVLHFEEISLDSWLLFTGNIWTAFKSIGEVLKSDLSFEIAIGIREIEESPAGVRLIALQNEVISLLKSDIISSYKSNMKSKGKMVRDTFVLLTNEVYEESDFKSICCQDYLVSKKSETYFKVRWDKFEKTLETLRFLEKIGSQRKEYREIEDLYVEPVNYDQIKMTLEKYNIVFIIGTPEIGKTYTAVRLLLEYSEDYEPVYIPEERRREQWELIRHKSELTGKTIYLEDPWGKVEFERIESLFGEIGSFIEQVKREKCKIILTSREKVFREFDKRKETAEDLWRYVNLLKVDLSYSKDNLIDMLGKYVNVFEPAWGSKVILREIAFEAIGKKLRTPMSIKKLMNFSKEVQNENGLSAAIERASVETKIAFAKEIKEMFASGNYDRLVFLSFPYILAGSKVAESCYERILKDLEYDLIKASSFYDLIEEFNEIEISFFGLRYVHPSYWDAFGFALTDEGKPNNFCKKIFSEVLLNLSEEDEAAHDVAMAVTENFDKLPEDVRNRLLLNLYEKYEVAWAVARTVVKNFDKLPEDVRNLLFNLSEKYEAAHDVAMAVTENFDKLPEDVRNTLLLNLSEKDEASLGIAMAVAENFDKLPEDVRNLLFNLSEKDEAAWAVARAVAENFDKLPEDVRNLLFNLSGKDEASLGVARAVADNFDKLPEDVRERLLLNLSEKDKPTSPFARTVVENFDKLPEDVRNRLLLNLSEKDEVTWAVADNFDKLPEDVRNLLKKSRIT